MYCKACGYLLNENDQICKKCGTIVYKPSGMSYEKNTMKRAEVNKSVDNNAEASADEELEFKWNVHEFPKKRRVTEDIDFDWAIKGDSHKTSRNTKVFTRKTDETEPVVTDEQTGTGVTFVWNTPKEKETTDARDSRAVKKPEPEYQAKKVVDAPDSTAADKKPEPERQAKETADIRDPLADKKPEPEYEAKKADGAPDSTAADKREAEYQAKETTAVDASQADKRPEPEYQAKETADILDPQADKKPELEYQAKKAVDAPGSTEADKKAEPEHQAKETADIRDPLADKKPEPEYEAKKADGVPDSTAADKKPEPEYQAKETTDIRDPQADKTPEPEYQAKKVANAPDLSATEEREPDYQTNALADAYDILVDDQSESEYQDTETVDAGDLLTMEPLAKAETDDSLIQDLRSWELPESSRDGERERFFTFNKKNEEFQRLLDKEYQRIKSYNNPGLRAVDLLQKLNRAEEEHDFSFILEPSGKRIADRSVDTERVTANDMPSEDRPPGTEQPTDAAVVLLDNETIRSEEADSEGTGRQVAATDRLDDPAQSLENRADQKSEADSADIVDSGIDRLDGRTHPFKKKADQSLESDGADVAIKRKTQVFFKGKADTAKSDSSSGSDKTLSKRSKWRKTANLTSAANTFEETFAALDREKEKLEKKEQSKKSVGGFVIVVMAILLVIITCMFLVWRFAPNSLGAYFINTGIDSLRRFLLNT